MPFGRDSSLHFWIGRRRVRNVPSGHSWCSIECRLSPERCADGGYPASDGCRKSTVLTVGKKYENKDEGQDADP